MMMMRSQLLISISFFLVNRNATRMLTELSSFSPSGERFTIFDDFKTSALINASKMIDSGEIFPTSANVSTPEISIDTAVVL